MSLDIRATLKICEIRLMNFNMLRGISHKFIFENWAYFKYEKVLKMLLLTTEQMVKDLWKTTTQINIRNAEKITRNSVICGEQQLLLQSEFLYKETQ